MYHLMRFNQELNLGHLEIHNHYIDQTPPTPTERHDVVTDLIDNKHSYSVAMLPIAKQITNSERKINLVIPKIGDLFVGIVHHPSIKNVIYSLGNYLEEFVIEGRLELVNGVSVWKITKLPIVLMAIKDDETSNLCIQIHMNDCYSLQNGNQDVFKAYYGYVHQSIKQKMMDQMIYEIPLLNDKKYLRIVCGLLSIVSHHLSILK